MVDENVGETGSREMDDWVEGGAGDDETTCRPVSDSAPSLSLS